MNIIRLKQTELDQINTIDRTELIEHIYYHENGQLVLKPERYDMKGFPHGELEEIISRQFSILENGGIVYGCFDGEKLIGVASHENSFIGKHSDTLKMDILFVSYGYRKKGIAKALLNAVTQSAKAVGANYLYISATPSENTVHFYLKCGARLAEFHEIDAKLFEMEPLDIHMLYAL